LGFCLGLLFRTLPKNGKPLEGIRVIDISQGVCGPYTSLLLADAGAQVVKVEPPEGDYARHFGPPFMDGESALFMALNRNKQSMVLDLEKEEGKGVLLRLLKEADIFVEDFGWGVSDRMGIGYEAIRQINQGLIYCSLSAFGDKGPLREHPASELVIQAMAEYCASLGAIGEAPERLGADVANLNTAVYAFIATLAAYFHRLRSGEGQRVSVSMLGTLLHLRGTQWSAMSDPDPGEWHGLYCDTYIRPRDHGYKTMDGAVYFNLGRGEEVAYYQLLIRLGIEHVLEDPRFSEGGRDAIGTKRYAHEVKPIWEEAFKGMTTEEVIALVLEHQGRAVKVNDYKSLFSHPQMEAIDMVREVELPSGNKMKVLRSPWRCDWGEVEVKPAPIKGQHTSEILRSLGYSEEDGARLMARGIVQPSLSNDGRVGK
jgi:crotonobetainyl-CoA:carnitine CoA-transferase CaiB-like acyl-CoA transferase